MSKVTLAVDSNGFPIVGALHPGKTIAVQYTNIAGINATPLVAQIVRLRSTTDCYIKFSTDGMLATSNDMFLKANQPEIFSLKADKYISAIRVTDNGTLYITIMD